MENTIAAADAESAARCFQVPAAADSEAAAGRPSAAEGPSCPSSSSDAAGADTTAADAADTASAAASLHCGQRQQGSDAAVMLVQPSNITSAHVN